MDDGTCEICECICNHSGACTGCGICWLKAYDQSLLERIQWLYGFPRGT